MLALRSDVMAFLVLIDKRMITPQELEQLATELKDSVAKHGDMAGECAPVYFKYGDKLLDFAAQQQELFEQEQEQLENEEGGEDEEEYEEEVEEEEEQAEADEVTAAADDATPATEEPEAAAEEEPVSGDMEVAWELLETARVILSGQEPLDRVSLAKVHLRLGDLSMESDQFDNALGEYEKSLQLRMDSEDKDERAIASLHYVMGMAYLFKEDVTSALKYYRLTFEYFSQRLESLVGRVSSKTTEEEVNTIDLIDKELMESKTEAEQADIRETCEIIDDLSDKVTLNFID